MVIFHSYVSFNPSEKYESNGIIVLNMEKYKMFQTTKQ